MPYTPSQGGPSYDHQGGNMLVRDEMGGSVATVAAAGDDPIIWTISDRPGRLCRVFVALPAVEGTDDVRFYDSLTDDVDIDPIIGALPGDAPTGSIYVFNCPVASGIYVVNPANGPRLTVIYD